MTLGIRRSSTVPGLFRRAGMSENACGGGGRVVHDVRISVLGGFDVWLDDGPVPDQAWRRNRARALVKLLALAPGRRLHREQVMDALWPSLDPEAAAGNLRKAIHFARGALGAEHVRVKGELIALEASGLWIDIDAFETAAQAGKRSEALVLYRGDLLPEDRFESWTEDPRERLRTRFHRLLLDEAASLEQEGSYELAADVLDRVVSSDPLHEDAHLNLMRVLALAGARHLALARYRQLEMRLRTELDVEPGPAAQHLHAEIAAGNFPTEAVSHGWRLGQAATPAPVSQDARPVEEERRLVTAVSAAIWAKPNDPEIGRLALDAWAAAAGDIAESWGGIAERQVGGDLAIVFGVPSAHEDDIARALRAALEIVAKAPGSSRVGIATGEIVAAGGSEPPLHRISGSVVAEAVSLRETAGSGMVIAAERTHRAAGRGFTFSRSRTVRSGGKATASWRLLTEERSAIRGSVAETPMIGRDPELAVILALFEEAVTSGRPRLVELSGPPGVGKSRLAMEASERIAARWPEAMVLRGRSVAGGREATFGALGDILREAVGIAISDSARTAQERLRLGLARLLGELDSADIEPTTFALATSAGIALEANPLERLPPAEVADRLALAWPMLASACAARAPALFLIEDLHWSRPELLDMIEHVVTRARGPLVLLVTARPELHDARPSFGTSGGDFSTIAIRPLGEEHSQMLLERLLGDHAQDPGTRRELLARAEGNPFFLEELTHHLRAGGSSSLPDTLQSLLAARLDALPIAERRVLQEAAVAGRTFWEAPIRDALGDERTADRLRALERKGFVVRRPASSLPGQAEFSIRHALLHDVAYESLSRPRRARAHAGLGSWLERLAGDRVDEVVDLLAHHYWSALSFDMPFLAAADGTDHEVIRAKAFAHVLRAGDAARRRFVTDRAVEFHSRARAIAADVGEHLHALEALAMDHEDEFHGEQAEALYREALALARKDPSRARDRARLCRRLAWMMAWNPGAFHANPDAEAAEALVDEGMKVVEDEAERAWLLLVRGTCARLYRGSEPLGQGKRSDPSPIAARVGFAEEALATARQLGRADLVVAARQALGMLYGLAGNYAEMLRLARRQVAELRPDDSRLDQSDAIRKLGVHLINVRADFEEGLELGWRCRALLRDSGAARPHQVMHTLWPILTSLFYLGRWDDLLGPLDEHIAAFRAEPATECQFVRDGPAIGAATLTLLGRPRQASDLAVLLGDPLLDRDGASAWQARLATISGDPTTARAISQDKAVEGRGYGPQHAFAFLEALSVMGEWDTARAFLPVARRTIPGNALLGPMSDRTAGLVKLADGETARAAALFRHAVTGFHRLKSPFEEARTLEALAEALPAGAEASRSAALAIYDRLGARPAARSLRDTMSLDPDARVGTT
jgi:DNA-binding SARP family transcriptional activator